MERFAPASGHSVDSSFLPLSSLLPSPLANPSTYLQCFLLPHISNPSSFYRQPLPLWPSLPPSFPPISNLFLSLTSFQPPSFQHKHKHNSRSYGHTFNTSASLPQRPDVRLTTRWALELVFQEVSVVRRCDEVVRERMTHILVDLTMVDAENVILRAQHELGESIQTHPTLPIGASMYITKLMQVRTYM